MDDIHETVATMSDFLKAAREGVLEKVSALLRENRDLVFIRDEAGHGALYEAAANGHKDMVEFLLANGADVNAMDDYGEKNRDADWSHRGIVAIGRAGGGAMHGAAANGHKDMVDLLLANKALVNAIDNRGDTPLHLAAADGHRDVVELLLANRAQVDAADNNRWTPIHMAAERGHKDVVELLLVPKAQVNDRDKNSWTPLHFAAANGHKDVAELLLGGRAEIDAKEYGRSWTPSQMAMDRGHKGLADLLRQYGGGFHDAILKGDMRRSGRCSMTALVWFSAGTVRARRLCIWRR